MVKQIFIFGSSISQGYWDRDLGGWVERLKLDLAQNDGRDNFHDVYNLGASGHTAEDLVNRVEFETYQRINKKSEKIFIFEIGTNDSAYFKNRGENMAPPFEFKENLQYLITLVKKYSEKIIFLGLTAVDEKRCNPWMEDMHYENNYIAQYNEIIKEVCERNNLFFIDILPEFLKIDYKNELLDEDGLHPNAKGHQKIFEIVRDFLAKNKII